MVDYTAARIASQAGGLVGCDGVITRAFAGEPLG